MRGVANRAGIALTMVLAAHEARAQQAPSAPESPRWTYEIRAGYLYPRLDAFSTYYGDNRDTYVALSGSYRFLEWLELGGEYGRMQSHGVGLLTSSGTLGGSVKLRLDPVQVFANFILQRAPRQRVVPYLGVGLATVRYEQSIELQGSRDGRTDLGHSLRGGLRFFLTSRDASSNRWRSYLLLEAQRTAADVDGIDLGGKTYVLGFRMEFDWPR